MKSSVSILSPLKRSSPKHPVAEESVAELAERLYSEPYPFLLVNVVGSCRVIDSACISESIPRGGGDFPILLARYVLTMREGFEHWFGVWGMISGNSF